MKIIEKWKEFNKKAEEQNIKEWKEHPTRSKRGCRLGAVCMWGLATTGIILVLIGNIQDYSGHIVFFSIVAYGIGGWIWIETNKLIKEYIEKVIPTV